MSADVWDGQWVTDHLGVELTGELEDFVGLALRRNPKRAHLLVSHHLGKHIPADPRAAWALGADLADPICDLVGSARVVVGYAETATALGHAVAAALEAPYLHTTRRFVPGLVPVNFLEEHSHAAEHQVLAEDLSILRAGRALVLVDDEVSTGRTAMNTIRALHKLWRRGTYVIASPLDLTESPDETPYYELSQELDTTVFGARLRRGSVRLPEDVFERAARILAEHPRSAPGRRDRGARVRVLDPGWPEGVRETGRHGYDFAEWRHTNSAARGVAAMLAEQELGDRVLVLGTEELMYTPLLIARDLAGWARDGQQVRISSTTRSPALAIDEPGYALRTALTFPAHDEAVGERYAYNVAPCSGGEAFTDIVLIADSAGDTPALWAYDGLVRQLATVCERLYVLVLPTYVPPP